MESTGVYWRPVFYLLEDEFECRLYNARHLRHVPGRKSDVQDAEWGCQLIEHGLVRASFVPPRPLRELRDLVRFLQHCFSFRPLLSNSPAWLGFAWIRRPFRLPCCT